MAPGTRPKPTARPQAPPGLRELELGFLLLASEGILEDAYLRTTELWMQNGPQESQSSGFKTFF